ncbi:MAG: CoA transferase, partial [Candidatus Nanopelagicales bacterium]|nr:CoA transferase [Candidatus Nanopelagicales bacterium]
NSVELLDILERVFATRTVESWTTQLRAASIPCGAVQTVGEALTDSHTIERGLIVETHTPALGDVKSVASAMRVGTRDEPHRRAPLLDEDRADILVSILSYNAEKIEQLNASNAFGTKTS